MVIDSHHHFWKYDPVEYDWIDDSMSRIRRDFLPDDLKKVTEKADVDGVISVQARQTVEETEWLLEMASENDLIKGVTGWVPLVEDNITEYLDRFSNDKKLKAVRHVVQGEPDDNFILRKDFNRGIKKLTDYDLIYEILIFEKHLPQTIRFVDDHPGQVFVLDHIAKPRIKENIISPWKENIRELARRENVFCKLSGMVTEADYNSWTTAGLKPYADVILDAFGPERLMFGSDWPVCLVAAEYEQWIKTVRSFIQELSENEQEMIMGKTAEKVYTL